MCLSKVEQFKVRKDYGYKWFEYFKKTRTYTSPLNDYEDYKLRRWCQPGTVINLAEYNAGFHIYYTLKDARKSFIKKPHRVLCKVKFKDYITGYGDGSFRYDVKQIVAQQMLIVKRIK